MAKTPTQWEQFEAFRRNFMPLYTSSEHCIKSADGQAIRMNRTEEDSFVPADADNKLTKALIHLPVE